METEHRAGGLLHFSGRQKVIEMGMGVQNSGHGEPKLLNFMQDSFCRSSGVYDNGLLGHRIADDRAIAAERGYREGFANQSCHHEAIRKYATAGSCGLQPSAPAMARTSTASEPPTPTRCRKFPTGSRPREATPQTQHHYRPAG